MRIEFDVNPDARILVLLFHGWAANLREYDSLKSAIQAHIAEADVLVPVLPLLGRKPDQSIGVC